MRADFSECRARVARELRTVLNEQRIVVVVAYRRRRTRRRVGRQVGAAARFHLVARDQHAVVRLPHRAARVGREWIRPGVDAAGRRDGRAAHDCGHLEYARYRAQPGALKLMSGFEFVSTRGVSKLIASDSMPDLPVPSSPQSSLAMPPARGSPRSSSHACAALCTSTSCSSHGALHTGVSPGNAT